MAVCEYRPPSTLHSPLTITRENAPQPKKSPRKKSVIPLLAASLVIPSGVLTVTQLNAVQENVYSGIMTSKGEKSAEILPVVKSKGTIQRPPTITGEFIDKVLKATSSPAQGTGEVLFQLGKKANIDPAVALAFFRHESTYGKNGIATKNKSLGNIKCNGDGGCNKGFNKYDTWEEGYKSWYKLIKNHYINNGKNTIERIIPIYAPSSENDVGAYIKSVNKAIHAYQNGNIS